MPVDLSRVRIDWRTAEPLCHSFVYARVIDLSRIGLLTPVARRVQHLLVGGQHRAA